MLLGLIWLVSGTQVLEDKLPAATQLAKIISSKPAAYITAYPAGPFGTVPNRVGFISSAGKFLGWISCSDIVPKGWLLTGLRFSPDNKSIFLCMNETDNFGMAEIVTNQGVVWKKALEDEEFNSYFWTSNNSLYYCYYKTPLTLIYGRPDRAVPQLLINSLNPYWVNVIFGSNDRFLVSPKNLKPRNAKARNGPISIKNSETNKPQITGDRDLDAELAVMPVDVVVVDATRKPGRVSWKASGYFRSLSPDRKFLIVENSSYDEVKEVATGKDFYKVPSHIFGELGWVNKHDLVYVGKKGRLTILKTDTWKSKILKPGLPDFQLWAILGGSKVILMVNPKKGILEDGTRSLYSFDVPTKKLTLIATTEGWLTVPHACQNQDYY